MPSCKLSSQKGMTAISVLPLLHSRRSLDFYSALTTQLSTRLNEPHRAGDDVKAWGAARIPHPRCTDHLELGTQEPASAAGPRSQMNECGGPLAQRVLSAGIPAGAARPVQQPLVRAAVRGLRMLIAGRRREEPRGGGGERNRGEARRDRETGQQ